MKEYPTVSVIITTHNRTRVAEAVIDSVCKNLSYSGELHWIVADDRSDPGHVETLVSKLKFNGVKNISFVTSTRERFGLGAALNQALQLAFQKGEVVLTTEDDWILQKGLNLDALVEVLMSDKYAAMIRLAATGKCERVACQYPFLEKVQGANKYASIMNLQVALRHKRLYDALGWYVENESPDTVESRMSKAYNARTIHGTTKSLSVFVLKEIKHQTLDDPSLYFIHVGKSTMNHTYTVPKRYEYIYDDVDNFFDIVMPAKNSSGLIGRAISSVLSQTFTSYKLLVVDDCSTDNTSNEVAKFVDGKRVFLFHTQHAMGGGGARNVALKNATGKYVLFLDSDDTFQDNKVLETIYNHIQATQSPDFVKLSFVINKSGAELEPRIYTPNMSEQDLLKYESPWCVCIKRILCPSFIEHRKRFNDVVWYLRAFDVANTMTAVSTPCVNYRVGENPQSVQFGEHDAQWYASIPYLLGDLLQETFRKQVVLDHALRILASKEKDVARIVKLPQVKTLMTYNECHPKFAPIVATNDLNQNTIECVEPERPKQVEVGGKKAVKPSVTQSKVSFGLNEDNHDAVFILGCGSIYNDLELLLAVKSMRKFCPFIDRIFIVGNKPRCNLSGMNCTHIPCRDPYNANKDSNMMFKVLHAIDNIPDLTDNFLLCSDDQLVTQPCTWEDFKPKYVQRVTSDDIQEMKRRIIRDGWMRKLLKTLENADNKRKKAWFYEPHIWSPVNKESFKEMVHGIGGLKNAGVIKSQYYNFIDNLDHEKIHDHKFFDSDSLTWSKTFKHPPKFLSYNDKAFVSDEFRNQLIMLLK